MGDVWGPVGEGTGTHSLRDRRNSRVSSAHSTLPRYPYPGKSRIVNFIAGVVYPFSVFVCPGLLLTLAKLCGACGNNAFNSDDFYNQHWSSTNHANKSSTECPVTTEIHIER